MNREHRIEQMGQANTMGLGDQPEKRPIAVEAPGPALLHHLQARLVVAVEQLVRHLALGCLVGEFKRLRADATAR